MASDAIKEERQRAKAAAQEKRVSDLARLRRLLAVHRVFRVLSASDAAARDLLAGENRAPLVSPSELEALKEVGATVRLNGGDDDPLDDPLDDIAAWASWDAAAENLQALLDGGGGSGAGSRKTRSGLSFAAVKDVLDKIVESGYCDRVKIVAVVADAVDASTTTTTTTATTSSNDSLEERSESARSHAEDNKGEFVKDSSEEG